MSKFTKLLALMLAVLFALSLAACGGDEPANTDTTTKPVASGSDEVTTGQGQSTTKTKKGNKDNKDNKKPDKTTINPDLIDDKVEGIDPLIERTTNKMGNASDKFVKSLKGFTLKILYPWENIYGAKKCQAAAEDSIKQVEKLYGVKIDEEGQFNKYNENLASELSARNCENHIYYAQSGNFASYFQKGYIADLSSAMREAGVDFNDPWYISDAKGFLNIDGRQYGWIPYEDEYTMPFCIIYNKKLLDKKKLADPAKLAEQGKWDWDTLQKYAKKFDNDKSVTGFVAPHTTELLASICQQYGTSLTKVSRGTQPTTNINDSKVKSALTELASWTVGKNAWCSTFSDKSWSYGKTQLAEGKVAMYFGFHDDIQSLSGTSTSKDTGIAPFPTRKGSKTFTNISIPQFIAFIPNLHQKNASKILFIRNEYYRYNYRFVNRNFTYKWTTYLDNEDAIENAKDIKYAKNGNKIVFSWTAVCESSDASVNTNTVVSEVIRGKSTPAQAINSKKNALTKAYSEVWSGHTTTGNV